MKSEKSEIVVIEYASRGLPGGLVVILCEDGRAYIYRYVETPPSSDYHHELHGEHFAAVYGGPHAGMHRLEAPVLTGDINETGDIDGLIDRFCFGPI